MEKRHKNLILDVNNLAWIVRFGENLSKDKVDPHAAELIAARIIQMAGDIAVKFKSDGILAAYDSNRVWRKTVYKDYKNRDHDDIYYEKVKEAIDLSKEFFDTQTNAKTCKVDHCEADDIIALAVQNSNETVSNIIVSTDRDFIQLLKYDNTLLYNPTKNEFRETDDPEFYLFEKCIRGDTSDNIFSAYPRVRKTRLQKAFEDETEMMSLMEHKRPDGEKVIDSYQFNKTLIDLECQPTHIRDNITADLNTPPTGKYDQVGMIKFTRDYKMKHMSDDIISGKYQKPFSGTFQLFDERDK